MKEKTLYVCGECGYETPRWMGKCPQCGSWNTLVEEERVLSHAAAQITTKAVPLQRGLHWADILRGVRLSRLGTVCGELSLIQRPGVLRPGRS